MRRGRRARSRCTWRRHIRLRRVRAFAPVLVVRVALRVRLRHGAAPSATTSSPTATTTARRLHTGLEAQWDGAYRRRADVGRPPYSPNLRVVPCVFGIAGRAGRRTPSTPIGHGAGCGKRDKE